MVPTVRQTRGHNLIKYLWKSTKEFNQMIYTLVPNSLQIFMSLTQVVPWLFCLQEFHLVKCLCLKRGLILLWRIWQKKKRISYFFISNIYMKFKFLAKYMVPNIWEISKAWRTEGWTYGRNDGQAQSNMPFQLLRSGGHKRGPTL